MVPPRRESSLHDRPSHPSPHPIEILFVTDRKFWRRSIGSEERIATLVSHLAREGFNTSVAYLGRIRPSEQLDFDRFAAHKRRLEVVARKSGRGALNEAILDLGRWARRMFKARKARQDAPTHSAEGSIATFSEGSPARREFVQSILRKNRPHVVIVEFLRLTYTVYPRTVYPRTVYPGTVDPGTVDPRGDRIATPPLYWIDTHDALHKRTDRYRRANETLPNAITAREEARLLATFDTILAIQATEAALFRELLPDNEVLLVPHGVDASKSLPKSRGADTPKTRGATRVGFLGGRDRSNRHALEWFIERVWPDIRSRFGDRVELQVAGQVCRQWTCKAQGVEILGLVESAEHFWNQVDIAINPVRFGSGLKIKNVEALAFGCALLTTPVGAEGIEAASPMGLRIASTDDEWKEALGGWLNDPDEVASVGRDGRAYADAHLTEDAAFDEIRTRLTEVLVGRSR